MIVKSKWCTAGFRIVNYLFRIIKMDLKNVKCSYKLIKTIKQLDKQNIHHLNIDELIDKNIIVCLSILFMVYKSIWASVISTLSQETFCLLQFAWMMSTTQPDEEDASGSSAAPSPAVSSTPSPSKTKVHSGE